MLTRMVNDPANANANANASAAASGGVQEQPQKQKRQQGPEEKRHHSLFEVPPHFLDSCRLLRSGNSLPEPSDAVMFSAIENIDEEVVSDEHKIEAKTSSTTRWSCNTCKAEFESLLDQRSHFKSDFHRFNVKLSISGKDTVKEEELDELISDSLFKDYDISSISGSEDEYEKGPSGQTDMHGGFCGRVKQKLFIHLQTGERVSIWKCLIMNEAEEISFESEKAVAVNNYGSTHCLSEKEVIERLKFLIHEPKDSTYLRIVLLASGGHFAGCVFDGNSVVTHKTFHRYVIRAKAGKKQSSKDASGKAAHSAGASLRRYNELALKKEIQELLAAWKPYFVASSCIFIYAPSNNRQLLFDGDKPYFSCQQHIVRNIPLTVRRPTFKEARRVYKLLTQVSHALVEESTTITEDDSLFRVNSTNDSGPESNKAKLRADLESAETLKPHPGVVKASDISAILSSEGESEAVSTSTPLHEAAKSGNTEKVLELLEQGADPCIKDARGWTPYMLASEKEVRNAFRRFMASNLEKWDWHAAKVPSALTKDMEESQAFKQAEKDAKRKARAKELKKLRKAREKKAQAEAAPSQNEPLVSMKQGTGPILVHEGPPPSSSGAHMSKEEELERARAAERQKRAAAAERRMAAAALNAEATSTNISQSCSQQPKGTITTDIKCSCCNTSLAGKVPFHRYNYKYCSTSCMHVHREMLEDG